jgi:ABC-type uncharacterized transport system involved in gliding motility auxiliary subunit
MKFLKNIASFGPALIVAGYVYYSIQTSGTFRFRSFSILACALTLVLAFSAWTRSRPPSSAGPTQYGTNSIVMTLIVIGILGMVNFLGKKHHKRVDLTSAQLYSLSDQSKESGTRAERRGPHSLF